MVNESALKSSHKDDCVPILGETGQTVVYIFPNGNARVRKGKERVTRQRAVKAAASVKATASPQTTAPAQAAVTNPPPVSIQASADLGQRLLQSGTITAIQLEVAKYDQSSSGLSLADVLLARGWVTEEAIASHLGAAS